MEGGVEAGGGGEVGLFVCVAVGVAGDGGGLGEEFVVVGWAVVVVVEGQEDGRGVLGFGEQ